MNVEMNISPTTACLFLSVSLDVFQQHPSAPALIHLLIFTLQGLLFLHRSPLGSHGNLKPFDCLVDGRMQVKLLGFGLWELQHGRTYRTYNEETTDPSGNHCKSCTHELSGEGNRAPHPTCTF